jgi:hypothetical protein
MCPEESSEVHRLRNPEPDAEMSEAPLCCEDFDEDDWTL